MSRISLIFLVVGACVPVEEAGESSQAEYGLVAPECTAQVVCAAGHWMPVFDCTTNFVGPVKLVKWSDSAQNFLAVDWVDHLAGAVRLYDSLYLGAGRYLVTAGGGRTAPFELQRRTGVRAAAATAHLQKGAALVRR